jgi:XRE family aerobic/anaerobic benzoate catabolism transcriptional regulator
MAPPVFAEILSAEIQFAEILAAQTRALRAARGLTRKGLAEAAGLSLRFVAEIEAGRANPSLSSLQALAGALGEHPFTLLSPGAGAAHSGLYERLWGIAQGEAESLLGAVGGMQKRAFRPIVLLGIRGAGKSTVGGALALTLSRPFEELDAHIEREAGMDLRAIFELHGEAHYRALERACLERVLRDPRHPVIAASGGAVTDDETRRLLRDGALTIWLKASASSHWERVIAQGDRRPMEGRARAFAELEDLLKRRAPQYAKADVVVDTTEKSPEAVVRELCTQIGAR